MAYQFSPLHPKQSEYEKEIWNILCGVYDDFVPLYQDGVINGGWTYSGGKLESGNIMWKSPWNTIMQHIRSDFLAWM